MQIAAVAVPAALLAFVTGSLLVVPLGGALGWFGVRAVVRVRTGRRTAAFEAALPDALQLLAGALRSGFALNQAIGVVVREGVEPVAAEFGRALQEAAWAPSSSTPSTPPRAACAATTWSWS